jgi:hypothetical protein
MNKVTYRENEERIIIKMWGVIKVLYSNGLVRVLVTILVSFLLGLVTGVRSINTLTNHVNGNTEDIMVLDDAYLVLNTKVNLLLDHFGIDYEDNSQNN